MDLILKDLYNPDEITSFLHYKRDVIIEAGENQRFQVYPNCIELWEMYEGRLMRVQRWLSKSILCTYTD